MLVLLLGQLITACLGCSAGTCAYVGRALSLYALYMFACLLLLRRRWRHYVAWGAQWIGVSGHYGSNFSSELAGPHVTKH
jgi:hypothetical protein